MTDKSFRVWLGFAKTIESAAPSKTIQNLLLSFPTVDCDGDILLESTGEGPSEGNGNTPGLPAIYAAILASVARGERDTPEAFLL